MQQISAFVAYLQIITLCTAPSMTPEVREIIAGTMRALVRQSGCEWGCGGGSAWDWCEIVLPRS